MDKTIIQLIILILTAMGITLSGISFKSLFNDTPTTLPVVTPSTNFVNYTGSFIINDKVLQYRVFRFQTEDEAISEFLKHYPHANVVGLIDRKSINELGYNGYYAWYNNTLAAHVVLKATHQNKVIIADLPSSQVITQDSLYNVEPLVVTLLEKIESPIDEDFR